MPLTAEQVAAYRRDGFVIVPGIYSADQMDRALEQADRIHYGMPYAEWAATATADTARIAVALSAEDNAKNAARAQFPTGASALDALFENSNYLDALEQLLGTQDVHFCNAGLFARAGQNDNLHAADWWGGFHVDHDTYSFLPPGDPPGEYDGLAGTILLQDVHPDGAPMVMLQGSHLEVPKHMAEIQRSGLANPPFSWSNDVRKFPFFDADKIKYATGTKGSVLFYSTCTVHAAQAFKNKSVQRSLFTLVATRRSNLAWMGFNFPYRPGERKHFVQFWQSTTPRVRALFGWPRPGHPYYTKQTLEVLHGMFPRMDLQPYYAALAL